MGHLRSVAACAVSVLLSAVVLVAISAADGANAGVPTEYDAACPPAAAPDPTTNPTRIMITGDSMSNGFSGDFTWRYFFDQHLRGSGVNFNFVGPWSDLMDRTTQAWGNHEYAVCGFDQDHLARGGGKLADQLAADTFDPTRTRIAAAVDYYEPEDEQAPFVVVEYYGYNDLIKPRDKNDATSAPYSVAEVIANAKKYIDAVRAERPNATVVMTAINWAKFPSGQPAWNKVLEQNAPLYNTQLKQKVADWTTPTSPVVYADVTKYWAGFADTYDGSHPTSHGEVHIAQGMDEAFAGLGIGSGPDLGQPLPPIGPLVAPVLEVSGAAGVLNMSWTNPPGSTQMTISCREPSVSTAWTDTTFVRTSPALNQAATMPNCRAGTPAANGHHYELVARAAKFNAVAEITSNVVALTIGTSTPTPTPTSSGTPTATPTAVGRVQGLGTTPGYHLVRLDWQSVPAATSYVVAWRKTGSLAWQFTSASDPSRVISGLIAGQSYDFSVRASTPASGAYSAIASARAAGVVPKAPPRPALTRLSGHRILVAWKAVSAATRYEVQFRVGSGAWQVLGSSTSTRYVTRGLVKGRSYGFRIRPYHQLIGGWVSAGSRITAS